jgi:hypothetical protein
MGILKSSCRKVFFLTGPHCQFRCVNQSRLNQTYTQLYLWHPFLKLNGIDTINNFNLTESMSSI